MKRFLILSIIAAFLAIPAISQADDYGSGTVASATFTASSLSGSQSSNNQTTYTMKTKSFAFKTGYLAFFEMSSVNGFTKQNGGSKYFRGQMVFAGPAKTSDGSQLSNLFINMSGFTIKADKTPSAELGQGSISGYVTHTDSPANGGQSGIAPFTGSYNMKVAFSGKAPNYTGGTANVTMNIASVQGNGKGVIVSVKIPAAKFTLLASQAASGAQSAWNLTHTVTSGPDYDPTNSGGDNTGTATLTLNQYGPDLIGTLDDGNGNISIDGTIVVGKVNMSFTSANDTGTQDPNGNEIYQFETTTVTGTLASGTFGQSGAVMSGTFSATDVNSYTGQTTAGDKGTWSATEN